MRQELASTTAPQVDKAAKAAKADTPPRRANATQAAGRLGAQLPMNDPHGTHLAVQTQLGTVSTYRFDPAKHSAFSGISPAFTPPVEADSPASLAAGQPSATGGSVLPQSSVQYFPWAHVREGPGFSTTPWQPPAWMAQQQQQMAQMVAQQALAQQQLVAQQQLQQAQLAQQQLVTQQYISQQAAAAASAVPAKQKSDSHVLRAADPQVKSAQASVVEKPETGPSTTVVKSMSAEGSDGATDTANDADVARMEKTASSLAAPPTVAPLSPDKHSLLPFETDLDSLRLGGFDFGEPDELGWSDEVFSLGEPVFN